MSRQPVDAMTWIAGRLWVASPGVLGCLFTSEEGMSEILKAKASTLKSTDLAAGLM